MFKGGRRCCKLSRLIHTHPHHDLLSRSRHNAAAFSTVTVPESKAVFDSRVHDLHKTRASRLANSYEFDYFRSEIVTRLISRILDLDGEYPVALDFGCHSGQLYKEMINFVRQNPKDKLPGGIRQIYQLDTCKELLFRDEIPDWQNALIAQQRMHIENFDNTPLPFDDDQFDIIVSGMSLQWINNVPFVFSEIARVLKPDGCFIGAFSGAASLQELRSSLLLADQERKGGMNSHMSPAINVSDIGSLLGRSGFVMVTVDNELIEIPYPNMFVLCEHLQGMGDQHAPYVPTEQRVPRYQGVNTDVFIAAAAIYDEMYSDSQSIVKEAREELNEHVHKNQQQMQPEQTAETEIENMQDKSVDATMQIIYFMSWAPAPTQRQPAERGSAQYSLKDFDEISDIIEQKQKEKEQKQKDKNDKDDNKTD